MKKWNLTGLAIGALTAFSITLPARAAKTVEITYSIFSRSISVASLENFAREGKVDREVSWILDRFTPNQRERFREFLNTRYNIDPVRLYRLGNSYAGDRLLTLVGQAIQLPGGENGYFALRGAIIHSAISSEGLSVINVIRNFPTDIRLDAGYLLRSWGRITGLLARTDRFITDFKKAADGDGKNTANIIPNFDLRRAGSFEFSERSLVLRDEKRARSIPIVLYLPRGDRDDIHVIFISSGLGSKIDRFQVLARHLASHGFAVVAVDHPNSSDWRQADFYGGLYKDPFDATEFIDRPRDISFILDYLQRENATQFQGRLNTREAGIFGYSFGGTTAFALGGAKIDFDRLQKDCSPPDSLVNISILYQCRALELPRENYELKDERIRSAFTFVPFGRSLYGQKGMGEVKIPVFWQTAGIDVITPILIEQAPPFSWLSSSEKYILLAENLPHARIILDLTNRLFNRQLTADRVEEVNQDYLNALTLAFFKVYVERDERFRSYLQPEYMKTLAEEPFNLFLMKGDGVERVLFNR
jgi:predicted dienelactone hydrolase